MASGPPERSWSGSTPGPGTGALAALAVIWIRRSVRAAPAFTEQREQVAYTSLADIFRTDLLKTILFASLFATGVQGGYYTLATWVPTYLATDRGLSAGLMLLYTQLPASADTYMLWLGFPLGFFSSAIITGFGSYLTELYPIRPRGAGQGFCYNVGRAIGAVFPAVIGFLAAEQGLGGAITLGTLAYVLVVIALFGLPETRARELA